MASRVKHRLIGAGLGLIAGTAADRWLGPLVRGQGAILMFHHVRPARRELFQPNRLLEITPEHLDLTLTLVKRLGYAIVPLDEVPARLARGDGRFVALTFDDGYRDNVEHALPVLRRHGAPWTLFVTTDYADGEGRLWWLELEEAVRALSEIPLGGRTLPSRTLPEKESAFATAYPELRAGPEARLRDTVARWCDLARLDRQALVRGLCLGWDELRALSAEKGLALGAHTLSHPMLAKHEEASARREIAESGRVIAARLGRPVRHFAYPVGDPSSAGAREFRLAQEAGYATAVTTRPGHVFPAHAGHLLALPRVSVNGLHQTEAALRALLSGVPFLLWNRGRRLNVG